MRMKPMAIAVLVAGGAMLASQAFAQSSSSVVTPSPSTVVSPTTSGQIITTTTGATSDAAQPKPDKKE